MVRRKCNTVEKMENITVTQRSAAVTKTLVVFGFSKQGALEQALQLTHAYLFGPEYADDQLVDEPALKRFLEATMLKQEPIMKEFLFDTLDGYRILVEEHRFTSPKELDDYMRREKARTMEALKQEKVFSPIRSRFHN